MIGPFRRHITTFIFGGVNRKIVTFSETPVRWRTPLRYAETFQNKREVGNIAILQYAICNMHGGDISSLAASSRQGVYSQTEKDSNLGTGSNNQNGNLRWILPLGIQTNKNFCNLSFRADVVFAKSERIQERGRPVLVTLFRQDPPHYSQRISSLLQCF